MSNSPLVHGHTNVNLFSQQGVGHAPPLSRAQDGLPVPLLKTKKKIKKNTQSRDLNIKLETLNHIEEKLGNNVECISQETIS